MAVNRNILVILHLVFIDFMIANEIFASQMFYNLRKYKLFEELIFLPKFSAFWYLEGAF